MACPNCGNTAAATATVCLKRSDNSAIIPRGTDGCYIIPVLAGGSLVFKDDAAGSTSVAGGSPGGLKLAGGPGIVTSASTPGGGIDGQISFAFEASELAVGAQGSAGGGSAASRYVGGDNQVHDLPPGGSGLALATTLPGQIGVDSVVGVGTTAARADHTHGGNVTIVHGATLGGGGQTVSSTTGVPVLTIVINAPGPSTNLVVLFDMDVTISGATPGQLVVTFITLDGAVQTPESVTNIVGRASHSQSVIITGITAGTHTVVLNARVSAGSCQLNPNNTNLRTLYFAS